MGDLQLLVGANCGVGVEVGEGRWDGSFGIQSRERGSLAGRWVTQWFF